MPLATFEICLNRIAKSKQRRMRAAVGDDRVTRERLFRLFINYANIAMPKIVIDIVIWISVSNVTAGIASNLTNTNIVYISCICFINISYCTHFRIAKKSKVFLQLNATSFPIRDKQFPPAQWVFGTSLTYRK